MLVMALRESSMFTPLNGAIQALLLVPLATLAT